VNKRCLRLRSKNSQCNLCEQVCNTGANKIIDGKPVYDAILCENCGLCETYCQAAALTGRSKKIISPSKRYACSQAGPVVDCTSLVCLAGLTAPIMLLTFDKGNRSDLQLFTGNCMDCRYNKAMELWRTIHLQEARNWLEKGGIKGEIQITGQSKDSALSRRELLGWLSGKLLSQIDELLLDKEAANQSGWEKVLAMHLDIAGRVPKNVLKVAGNCTMCEICSRICPLQALEIRLAENRKELHWKGIACTECGLCLELCPQRVLTWVEGNWAERGAETIMMAKYDIKECPACGRIVNDNCPYCTLEG